MDNNIVWNYADEKINKDKVLKIEDIWNVKLPEAYVKCAMCNHGGSPEPEEFMVANEAKVFGCLLSYDKDSPDNIIQVYNGIKKRLLNGIFPFACDPAGNYICFDYRNNVENPKIIFWKHELGVIEADYSEEQLKLIDIKKVQEKAVIPVSNSFEDFLKSLF